MEQQLTGAGTGGTSMSHTGRTLMDDRKSIARTVKNAQGSANESDILNSGSLVKAYIPGNNDVKEYAMKETGVASILVTPMLLMRWFLEVTLRIKNDDSQSFMNDFYTVHRIFEDAYMSTFMKAYQITYSKQFYTTPLADIVKQNTCGIAETVKIGTTSITRRYKWIVERTGELLVENNQLSVLVDLRTRRPMEISPIFRDRYSPMAVNPNFQWQLQDKPSDASKKVCEFQYTVTDKDMDGNNHANTFVYYLLALESLIRSMSDEIYVKQATINYQNESKNGTVLTVTNWATSPTEYFCQIVNTEKQHAVCSAEFELYTNLIDTPANL